MSQLTWLKCELAVEQMLFFCACALLLVFEKFTCAYLFQIALKIV